MKISYLILFLFFQSCLSSKNGTANNFYIESSSIVNNNKYTGFSYNSNTGEILKNGCEFIIKINEAEKRKIIKYYTKIKNSNKSSFVKYMFEDNINIILVNIGNENAKMINSFSEKNSVDNQLLFYFFVLRHLMKKKEYEEHFPQEFLEY